jgi:superfamily II DNA or RNA helicase
MEWSSLAIPTFTSGLTLHDWQRECVHTWMASGRGTVKVVTGAGKTVVGLAIIEQLWRRDPELRAAIVVPTVVLMNQWYSEIESRGTLPMELVGRAGGGKRDSFEGGARILILVLNTASKKLASDVEASRIGEHLLLIVDECHRAGAKVMSRTFHTRRRYSLGLSATPERSEEPSFEETQDDDGWMADEDRPPQSYEETLLGRELGPIVYTLSLAKAIDIGVLPPFEIRHYGVDLTPRERAEYDALSRSVNDARTQLEGLMLDSRGASRGLVAFARGLARRAGRYSGVANRFVNDAQRRKLLLYRAANRSLAVQYLLQEEFQINPKSRAILFHESIEEIERLATTLKPGLSQRLALEHSKIRDSQRAKNIEAFRKGKVQILISVKSLIEGFNVPAADIGVIVASSSSVRQRVQTLGRILRRHTSAEGEEKHAVMHVIYVRNSVDESIYDREDWGKSTGEERNLYFHILPPEHPMPQLGPPREPLPSDADVDEENLVRGGPYPGRLEGTEFTTDSQRNVKSLAGTPMQAPQWLWEDVVATKKQAGKFRVTPRRHYVLVRIRDGEEWVTRYIGRLSETLAPAQPAEATHLKLADFEAGSSYDGPTDDQGGTYLVRQSAAGRRIARKIHGDRRGLKFAKETNDTIRILKSLDDLRTRGMDITHFQVNSRNDTIAMHGGRWLLIAQLGEPLEF